MTDNKNQRALEWLNKQLKKKLIALERAEQKPNRSDAEIADINSGIDILMYLIEVVMNDER